jgi:hypothetical protein
MIIHEAADRLPQHLTLALLPTPAGPGMNGWHGGDRRRMVLRVAAQSRSATIRTNRSLNPSKARLIHFAPSARSGRLQDTQRKIVANQIDLICALQQMSAKRPLAAPNTAAPRAVIFGLPTTLWDRRGWDGFGFSFNNSERLGPPHVAINWDVRLATPSLARPRNGLGVAALVVGVGSLVAALSFILFPVGLLGGLAAVVLGGIAAIRGKAKGATKPRTGRRGDHLWHQSPA